LWVTVDDEATAEGIVHPIGITYWTSLQINAALDILKHHTLKNTYNNSFGMKPFLRGIDRSCQGF
jgi:hypothetical protein